MNTEIALSLSLTGALVGLAYSARRSFAGAHLLALGAFCAGLPVLKASFGGESWPTGDEVLWYSYGAIGLYALFVFLGSYVLRDRALAQTARWLRTVNPSGRTVVVALFAILVLWALRLYKAASYGILFSGSGTEDAVRSLPYWLSTLASLTEFLGGGAMLALILAAARGRTPLILAIPAVGLPWALLSGGRREAIVLSVAVAWVIWRSGLMRPRWVASGLALGLALTYLLTPMFLLARNINAAYLQRGVTPFEAFQNALVDGYSQCGISLKCAELTRANVTLRGNAMEFLKSVVTAERAGFQELGGAAALNTVKWALPSILGAKPELMTEQYVQSALGLPIGDDAISVPLVAYADMGLLGCAIAGTGVAVYLSSVGWLAFVRRNELLLLSLAFGAFRVAWNIEEDPVVYLTLLRDAVIVALVMWGLDRMLVRHSLSTSGFRFSRQRRQSDLSDANSS